MKKFLIKFIRRIGGSVFFIGYFPFMSGTIASLATVGALWYFRDDVGRFFTPQYAKQFFLMYCAFVAVAIFFSNNAKDIYGKDDPKQVVIDEVAGQLLTFFLHPLSWSVLLMGFLLFRFYDIVKPFPVHAFEDLEDGLGITMDDVAAGVLANISLFIIIGLYHATKAHL